MSHTNYAQNPPQSIWQGQGRYIQERCIGDSMPSLLGDSISYIDLHSQYQPITSQGLLQLNSIRQQRERYQGSQQQSSEQVKQDGQIGSFFHARRQRRKEGAARIGQEIPNNLAVKQESGIKQFNASQKMKSIKIFSQNQIATKLSIPFRPDSNYSPSRGCIQPVSRNHTGAKAFVACSESLPNFLQPSHTESTSHLTYYGNNLQTVDSSQILPIQESIDEVFSMSSSNPKRKLTLSKFPLCDTLQTQIAMPRSTSTEDDLVIFQPEAKLINPHGTLDLSILTKQFEYKSYQEPLPLQLQQATKQPQPSPYLSYFSQDGLQDGNETFKNQDSIVILDEFFENAKGKYFKLVLLCDGHGPDGHLIAQHVASAFPKILESELANANLAQYSQQDGTRLRMNNFMASAQNATLPQALPARQQQNAASQSGKIKIVAQQPRCNTAMMQNRWEIKKKKNSSIKKALCDSFQVIQGQITANNYYHDARMSGTTLSVLLLADDNMVFSANVGDSQAFLFKIEKDPFDDEIDHTVLTFEHSPLHQREFKRIQRHGGEVRMPRNLKPGERRTDRVYFKGDKKSPALHISRSIGDTQARSVGILSEPDVSITQLKTKDYNYLILLGTASLYHNFGLPSIKDKTRRQLKTYVEQNGTERVPEQLQDFAFEVCESARDKINDRVKQAQGAMIDDVTAICLFYC
ncbi:hypothetical protein FGO68_gene15312 [Halteria grandinella]|uniref:protein-serine/threonine phosphatase n=1 Tax=Halteria grandinella TaxID=5974 RepID=A0A8J8T4V8_HALGN|nr:hypothetical protein FGO68_gene15312 [Halteria grandinella]